MKPPPTPTPTNPPGTIDEQGRILCTARRNNGSACNAPAVTGMQRCRNHLGFTVVEARRQVQEAIALLAVPALAVAWQLVQDDNTPPAVKAVLVRDILDRAGHAAARQLDVTHRDLTDAAARAAEAAGVRDELEERRLRQAGAS